MAGSSPELYLGGALPSRPRVAIYRIPGFSATVSRGQPKFWISSMSGVAIGFRVGTWNRPAPKIRPGPLSELVDFFLEPLGPWDRYTMACFLSTIGVLRPTPVGPTLLVPFFGDQASLTGPRLFGLVRIRT
ncbi:hypothetical protein V6N13_051443 [Hibiscus sabdariffa]|uniref:Uncharacterized protein n=1 Tax=Hibiscus sabdariffa TaxID=183260 RepID=A0ABR2T411_9ROSI